MFERLQQCSWDLALPPGTRKHSAAAKCQQVREGDWQSWQPCRIAPVSSTHHIITDLSCSEIRVAQDTNTILQWSLQQNVQPVKCDIVSHTKNPFSQCAFIKERGINSCDARRPDFGLCFQCSEGSRSCRLRCFFPHSYLPTMPHSLVSC